MTLSPTRWIWSSSSSGKRNLFLRFRRTFAFSPGRAARLQISADSRYWVYLDGEYLGTGPVRSWPEHWKYDEYDLGSFLTPGHHTLAVLVNHHDEGNFQYLPAPPGLTAQLVVHDEAGRESALLETDATWKTSFSPAHRTQVPRISVQESFEEQFDARLDDGWRQRAYDDSSWEAAVPIAPAHPVPRPSGIPLLTREPVFPQRVVRTEIVRPATLTWTLHLKPYYAPDDFSSKISFVKSHLFTQIWSRQAQTVVFLRPHHHTDPFKVNGRIVPALSGSQPTPQNVRLRAGWNPVLFPYPGLQAASDGIKPPHATHFPQFVLAVTAARPLRWLATRKQGSSPWAWVGPFAFTEEEDKERRRHVDFPRVTLPRRIDPAASAAAFAKLWATGQADPRQPYFQELAETDIVREDVAASAFADQPLGPGILHRPEALLSLNDDWALLQPGPAGCDVRVLIDFGREILGQQAFEVSAEEGVVLDVHNFEFIQPDGLENYADGMNNTFRYICRGGRQNFLTLQRRGFQYTWLIARNLRAPLRLRAFYAEFNSYPQVRRGSFASSDALLNRIWEVGAHTLRCCSEDTYTDCPTYEQTHWVGDARNEALIDWVINGDPRLWYRCLEQTAQSLERSPMTLSHVPSSWENILPAWSFLWMRSCREYLLWTGDQAGAKRLLPWVERNVAGVEKHLNAQGLFQIQGWNMFDWAEMDTPSDGVITHLNCFAVLALTDGAELARWLGNEKSARKFAALAASLKTAINRHLWDASRCAYLDSIHADGRRSTVFSQQTQTIALIARVASGMRAARCRAIVHRPPRNFVKAGSPFYEFFLLEVLAGEKKSREFLDLIRRDWGFMIEKGATTFWEMWSLKTGRLTRSHCHGWSAAPTFFLSTFVLGVHPTKPGFAEISFSPQLGDLDFACGTIPTPHGLIEVHCQRRGRKIEKSLRLPPGVRLQR